MRSPPTAVSWWRRILWRTAAVLCVGTAGAVVYATTPAPRAGDKPAATIETAGTVLGIGIGKAITEARTKLDPLRGPVEHEPDAKERENKRIYWKLKETEY